MDHLHAGERASPRAIVYCLHGKDGDHRRRSIGSASPGPRRAWGCLSRWRPLTAGLTATGIAGGDGSDALAMLLNEFVPLVRARVGPLPQALMGARFGPGSHDDAFWCSVAAAQLRAIAAATGMRLGGVALSG
jgi:hypothetical protein